MKPQALGLDSSRLDTAVIPSIASGKNVSRTRVIAWLLKAISLLYVLSCFIPSQPPKRVGLIEESYLPVLHQAFIEKWQFGRDIIFTFGPWGFLYGGFHPSTHAISVCVWAGISLIFWWAAWRAAHACFNNDFAAGLWVVGFTVLADLTMFLNLDSRLAGLLLLLLLNHFWSKAPRSMVMEISLVVAIALLSLVKFSMLMAGSIVILLFAADMIFRARRFPWHLLVFGAAFLSFWMLAGQQFGSLLPFIRTSCLIANGYTEGMSLELSNDVQDVWWFVVFALLLTLLAAYAAWRHCRFWGMLPLCGLAFLLFSAFKYGYVRHDGHEVAATMQLSLVALVILAMAWKFVPGNGPKGLLAFFLPMALVLCFTIATFNRYATSGFFATLFNTFGFRSISAPLQLLHGNGELADDRSKFFGEIRRQFPVQQLDAAVDEYSCNQVALFANGLRYRPRPIIQSYSAYTPELAEFNAASLRRISAPDYIIFEPQPIDAHFPALEDGPSWPELVTRYDVVSSHTNGMLLLKKAPTPRTYQKLLLEQQTFSFGTPVNVPAQVDGPIWAEMEISKSILGKAISTIYKPPELALSITLRDGKRGKFRLIPGMARAGFLISPFIRNAESFGLLASREGFSILSGMEVQSLTVTAANAPGTSACYQSAIAVRFYRLNYPRQE